MAFARAKEVVRWGAIGFVTGVAAGSGIAAAGLAMAATGVSGTARNNYKEDYIEYHPDSGCKWITIPLAASKFHCPDPTLEATVVAQAENAAAAAKTAVWTDYGTLVLIGTSALLGAVGLFKGTRHGWNKEIPAATLAVAGDLENQNNNYHALPLQP